jgi:hypothetical protein
VRVISFLFLELPCANLAGEVKSENMQHKDSSEAKDIIDDKCLIEGGKSPRLAKGSHYHDEGAEDIDQGA